MAWIHCIIFIFFSSITVFSSQKEYFCPLTQLAKRTSQPSCAAQFKSTYGEVICISREQWLLYLNSKSRSLCGFYTLKKKVFSPLEPRVHFQKIQIIRLYLDQIQNSEDSNFFEKVKKKIEWLREVLSQKFRKMDSLGLQRSLILFEKDKDTPFEIIRLLGFVHLYTETGIHLYLLYHLIEKFIYNFLFYFSFSVRVSFFFSRSAAWVSILTIWIFSGLREGFIRPFFILILRRTSKSFGFKWRVYAPLFLSLFWDGMIWLIYYTLFNQKEFGQGRLYYGLAVGGGLFFLEWVKELQKRKQLWLKSKLVNEHIAMSIGSWIGPAVIEVLEWHMVSLAIPILNILSVPVVCLFFFPLTLFLLILSFILPEWAQFLLDLATVSMNSYVLLLSQFTLFFNLIWIVSFDFLQTLLTLILSMAIFFIFYLRKSHPLYFKSGIIFLVFLGLTLRMKDHLFFLNKNNQSARIYVKSIIQLDVGQGDSAILIYSNGAVGLIDAGSFLQVRLHHWLKILAYYRIDQIDFIVLSHLDEDHVGGLLHILKIKKIKKIFVSRFDLKSMKGVALDRKLIQFDLKIERIKMKPTPYFTVLEAEQSKKKETRNDQMLSVLVPLKKGGYFLSAGDTHGKKENRIINWLEAQSVISEIKVFKVSHHGSKYSSSIEFLDKLRPKLSWVSSGFGNRYGHPSAEVLLRFRVLGLALRRTDLTGSLYYSDTTP